MDRCFHLFQFVHQRLVHMQAAGGIDEHRVTQQGIGPFQRLFRDFHRRNLIPHGEHRHVQLSADDFQLGNGRRTVHIPSATISGFLPCFRR